MWPLPHTVVQSCPLKTASFQSYSLRLMRLLMMPQDISWLCIGEEGDLFCHWGNPNLVFNILVFFLLLVTVRLYLCPAMATLLGYPRRSGLLFPHTPVLGHSCSVSHLSDLSLLRSHDDSAVHSRDNEFQRLVLFHWGPPFLSLLPVLSPRFHLFTPAVLLCQLPGDGAQPPALHHHAVRQILFLPSRGWLLGSLCT